jgi:N-acyl-D-amino-acid deacylase
LTGRGVLEPGAHADVVVFDPATVGTGVRPDALIAAPTGVPYVFVNGTCVVDQGRPTDALPGVVGVRS